MFHAYFFKFCLKSSCPWHFLAPFFRKNDAGKNVKKASENQMKLKDDSKSTSKAFLMI